MPTIDPTIAWYSFDYGPAHFSLISTEQDFTIGSIQNIWLENDLASVNRTITPWLIIAGHRPMYVDSLGDNVPNGDQPVASLMRQELEPMMLKYKVNLALWGHFHSYQRSCPIFNGTCTIDSIYPYPTHVLIAIGAAGTFPESMEPIVPFIIWKLDIDNHGFARININGSHLNFQYVTNHNGILDQFDIYLDSVSIAILQSEFNLKIILSILLFLVFL